VTVRVAKDLDRSLKEKISAISAWGRENSKRIVKMRMAAPGNGCTNVRTAKVQGMTELQTTKNAQSAKAPVETKSNATHNCICLPVHVDRKRGSRSNGTGFLAEG
jgi:hypothetical protein